MGLLPQPRRRLLLSLGGAALLCLNSSSHAQRKPGRATLTPWQQAQRTRETFEAANHNTTAAFAPVLDAFRAIYHDNPRDLHAADAVNAVAQLLTEQGRALDDQKSLHDAVAQYEFLRQQYPTSSLRWSALLAEAQIEDADLHDSKAAHQKYVQLIHTAPRSAAAGEARVALAEESRAAQHPSARAHKELTPDPSRETVHASTRKLAAGPLSAPVPAGGIEETDLPEYTPRSVNARSVNAQSVTTQSAETPHTGRSLALVTGIRHWSTSSYTRVAIDLGAEVTFQAARVPNPDRIYFDLHGAKLAPELIGKSFNITDDGFLQRIRAAQDSPNVTRVVLDVSQVADYSAFLLPNPYRLIIDIHGAKPATPETLAQSRPRQDLSAEAPVAANAVLKASAAADSSGLPAMAPTQSDQTAQTSERVASSDARSPRPQRSTRSEPRVPPPRTSVVARATTARPVPNTVETPSPATTAEVAEVSHAPGREEATSHPTSQPIASTPHVRRSRHQPSPAPTTSEDAGVPARAAARTADGETSLTRALGLGIGRIVIDAGHGGHDSGTLGVDGIEEKDVVLDVALRLGKLLHDRLGAEIIYTRSDDTFIPLETRTAIANKAQADLFLSIHANSSSDSTARGVETYYLNFTSDPSALDVAARENAVSGQSIHQLSSLVKKIALKDKIDESREFASDVESSLFTGLEHGNSGLKNRGVKKAPFVVLIGANMPSILAEISFVTNPRDANELRQPDYRQRVAESLYRGVQKYEQGLAATRSPNQNPAPPVARAAVR